MPMFNAVHPGTILREYMGDSLTVTTLAQHLNTPRENLSRLLNGRIGVSAVMAVKLSQAFPKTDPQMWLNLQNNYDLDQVRKLKVAKVAPLLLDVA